VKLKTRKVQNKTKKERIENGELRRTNNRGDEAKNNKGLGAGKGEMKAEKEE
jgi:hypothetical protein